DIETLDLLEELLLDFGGTLLVVSHDRAFLDNVVTSTLVMEGKGKVGEYAGGYSDWVRQRPAPASPSPVPLVTKPATDAGSRASARRTDKPRRLSFREQKELDALPGLIDALEQEKATL